MSKYYPGKGCECFARSESECACGVDWTDPEIYQLRERVSILEAENHKVKTKLSDYASQIWVLQELRDRAASMNTESYTDTTFVKMYANGIHHK